MPSFCCVPNCNQKGYTTSSGEKVSFFNFPKAYLIRKQWIHAIRREEGKGFVITERTKVCSLHFRSVYKIGLRPARLPRFVAFVHLPFSFRSFDLFVASLLFAKGTSHGVTIMEKIEPRDGKLKDVVCLSDFRCYLRIASLILTPL